MFPEKLKFAKSAIPCHLDTSEVVVCIYGSVIEHFYDVQSNEAETVVMKVVSGIFLDTYTILVYNI